VVFICKHFLAKQFGKSFKQPFPKEIKTIPERIRNNSGRLNRNALHAISGKSTGTLPKRFPGIIASVFREQTQTLKNLKPQSIERLTNPYLLND